jgi:HPt (histidine-containing phosphotransfer) domain-containing protein
METIQTAFVEGDGGELSGAAHALKGSALNLGAATAAELCQTIEDTVTAEGFAGLDGLIESLAVELDRAESELRSAIDGG